MAIIPFNSKKYRTKYNNNGTVRKAGLFLSDKVKSPVTRLPPSAKWYQPTRLITNTDLDTLSNKLAVNNTGKSFEIILDKGKLPFSLFDNTNKNQIIKKTKKKTEKFENVLKRKIEHKDFLLENNTTEKTFLKNNYSTKRLKGQSTRIYSELYKVIDCSNILIHVLDAREPLGTFNTKIFEHLKTNTSKPVILILNKVDLIPTSLTMRWLKYFTEKFNVPVLPFHSSSLTNFYGKSALLNLLRQYSRLYRKTGVHKLSKLDNDRNEQINKEVNNLESVTVGVFGMPNVGKSSLINILANKKSCKVAPIAGETKTWQYISIAKNFYLLDCPGVVQEMEFEEAVKRGAVRIEKLTENEMANGLRTILNDNKIRRAVEEKYGVEFYTTDNKMEKFVQKEENTNKTDKTKEEIKLTGENFGGAILDKINKLKEQKIDTVVVNTEVDINRFIEEFGRKYGKLKKGDLVCEHTVAQNILNDFIRGKIPFFSEPPTD